MSDLRPKGVPIMIGGVERKLLFTFNVVLEIQSKYDKTVSEVLDDMIQGDIGDRVLFSVLTMLLEDEDERIKFYNPTAEIHPITEKELGWFVCMDNQYDIIKLIFKAYGITVPETGDDDPNRASGQQSN